MRDAEGLCTRLPLCCGFVCPVAVLRQGIFEFRLIVVQRLYGCIESDGHTGRSRKNKLVPERVILSLIHI